MAREAEDERRFSGCREAPRHLKTPCKRQALFAPGSNFAQKAEITPFAALAFPSEVIRFFPH